MTKYYIGYLQGNDEYIYISNITPSNVGVTTTTDNALEFNEVSLAKGVLNYIKTKLSNQEIKILEIIKEIKEIEEE